MIPLNEPPLPHGLLLGYESNLTNTSTEAVWDHDAEGHLLTIAPTGAGKGVSCIIPALLTWQGPAIVIDPRGENYAVTHRRRLAMGQQIHVLDPFGITDCATPASLNPLDIVQPTSDSADDDMAMVSYLTMTGKGFKADPFWDERANAMIVAIMRHLFETELLTTPTLGDVNDAISELNPPDDAGFFRPAFHEPTKADKVLSNQAFGTGRLRTSISTCASSQLGFVRSAAVRQALSYSTIKLPHVTAGRPMTIYIVLPADKLTSHGKLLRLWLGVLLAAIGRRRSRPPLSTLFLVDEAAQLGELDQLRSALTLMRGYGVRVWTFWQDLSQLQHIYDDWQSLVNNSTVQQFFGGSSPHAHEQLRTYLGSALTRPLHQLQRDDLVLWDRGQLGYLHKPNYLTDVALRRVAAPNPLYPADPGQLLTFPGR